MNRDLFTVIAWDPRGYGNSIPPERTWENFFERDANDATTLMKVISVDIFISSYQASDRSNSHNQFVFPGSCRS